MADLIGHLRKIGRPGKGRPNSFLLDAGSYWSFFAQKRTV